MRKKLTTYIEDDYIEILKRLAFEQETSVADILNYLIKEHLERDIVCACDLPKYLQTNIIQYEDKIFEFNTIEDLGEIVKFYCNGEEVCSIESEFFQLIYKNTLIELIPLETSEFVEIKNKFIKFVK